MKEKLVMHEAIDGQFLLLITNLCCFQIPEWLQSFSKLTLRFRSYDWWICFRWMRAGVPWRSHPSPHPCPQRLPVNAIKKYYKNDNICLILLREANQKLSNIPLLSDQLRRWRAIAHQLIDSNLSFAIEKFVCKVGYLDCADSLKSVNDRLSLLFFC